MSSVATVQSPPNILIASSRQQAAQILNSAQVDADGDFDGSGPGDNDRGTSVNIKA